MNDDLFEKYVEMNEWWDTYYLNELARLQARSEILRRFGESLYKILYQAQRTGDDTHD